MFQTRELPVAEWPKLAEIPGPLYGTIVQLNPAQARILVVEDADHIIAYWAAFNAVHAEPLWITEDYRHNIAVITSLLNGMLELLRAAGVNYVFAIIGQDDLHTTGSMAERIGFLPVPGTLYGGQVPEKAVN